MAKSSASDRAPVIRTPDQRLRVFVSSTLRDLGPERQAVSDAVRRLRLAPVMFESSARTHPPRDVYRAYLAQSHIFVGVYWQSYGWVAPGEETSGLEDEYRLAAGLPKLLYVKSPAPDRQVLLTEMLNRVKADDDVSYQRFSTPAELQELVETDLAVLLSERFEMTASRREQDGEAVSAPLPLPPTPLVGREGAIASLEGLLVQHGARLITLTGPGGVGKSRLALALAERSRPSFEDGARFIELAPVSAPDRVLPAIAAGLGLATSGGKPTDVVKAYLRSRRLLLVLDNFEQVIGAGPLVADLLSACPAVAAVVTSRTVLNLRGEHEFAVPALAVPDQGQVIGMANLEGFDAVRLFVERAQAASASFELSVDNASEVAEICRRLDGLPLAIELAAAKVRMFPPQALLARLDHRLALLTGGPRDLPERQRTLRHTLDWSFDLLAPTERSLLARLGVFVGGFDLPAAEAVGGVAGGDLGAEEVETALSSLTESSLLRQEALHGEPRFQMLETIREYALERLRQSEDWQPAHSSHATYYLGLARRAAPSLSGRELVKSLEGLEVDHGNLAASMSWLVSRDEFEPALSLGGELWQFWSFQGHAEEWADYGEQILASNQLSTAQLATALAVTGLMQFFSGQPARARALLEQSRSLSPEYQDKLVMAYVACVLGCLLALNRDFDPAKELVEESRSLQQQLGNDTYMPFTYNVLGRILLSQNDASGAADLFAEGLTGARRLSDRYCELLSLYDLSLSSQAQNDLVTAAEHLETGVLLSLRLDENVSWAARTPSARQAGAAYFIDRLAVVIAAQQDLVRAVRLHAAARGLLRTSVGGWLQVNPLLAAPDDESLVALRSQLGEQTFNEAWEQGAAIEPTTIARYALEQKRLAFAAS